MKVSYQKRIVIMITLIFSLLLALVNIVKANGVIKEGDNGTEVKALQQKLIQLGFDLGSYVADGSFGQCTLDAVKGIQSASGITTDGIVGPATNSKVSE